MRRYKVMPAALSALLLAAALVAVNPLSSGAAAPCRLSKSVDSLQNSYTEKQLVAEIAKGGCITVTYGGKVIAEITSLAQLTGTATSTPPAPPATSSKPTSTAPTTKPPTSTRTTTSNPPSSTKPSTSAAPSPTQTSTGNPVPTGTPTTIPPAPTPGVPARVLDLTKWWLDQPINTTHDGNPDIIRQPELDGFSSAYTYLNPAGDGVVLLTPAGGPTTSNSSNPRTEFREMANDGGQDRASWTASASSPHTLTIETSLDEITTIRKQTVLAQIHDGDDDVMQVAYDAGQLVAFHDNKNTRLVLDPAYVLGTRVQIAIRADGKNVEVYLDGVRKSSRAESGSGWYFKTGNYLQTNLGRGESATSYAKVTMYSLQVTG